MEIREVAGFWPHHALAEKGSTDRSCDEQIKAGKMDHNPHSMNLQAI
jgi:hypothetical protein